MSHFKLSIIFISILTLSINYEFPIEKIAILDGLIQQQINLTKVKTVGFVIANESGPFFTKIYGETDKVTTKSPFILGSVSKSFTALGILHLNIPINKTIDEFGLDDYIDKEMAKDITISDLLHHISGLDSFSNKRITQKGKFSYSNYGYALLGKIIEKQSGKSYADYMKEKIFDPIGMKNAQAKYHSDIIDSYNNFLGSVTKYGGLKSEIGDGFYLPAGFISASMEDMGKYLHFYLKPENEKYVSQMTKGRNVIVGYKVEYGMGVVIRYTNNQKSFDHEGDTKTFLTHFFVYPERNLSFFIAINTRDYLFEKPILDFVNNIENFILNDVVTYTGDPPIFYIHFSIDIVIFIAILIPFTYLVITIIRKVQRKEYSWLKGVKGIVIFAVEILLLLLVPSIIIICFYTADDELKRKTENTRDYKFGLFTVFSTCLLIFLIKLVYMLLFDKYIKINESSEEKKSNSEMYLMADN